VGEAGGELTPVPIVPPPSDPPTGLAGQVYEFKRSYIYEDAARWAEKLGLAWNPPEDLTVDVTDASAGWYFARDKGGERGYRNRVFRARWCEGRDIGQPEVLADCAGQAGLNRDEFLDALRTKRYHEEVPKALALCMQEKVFGVPIFVVNGKRLWGNDRIDFLLEELRRS
jgi:2-hydroxychromene-2-carboxylate isomerase